MNIELLLGQFCQYAKYIRGVSDQTKARYEQKVSFFIKFSGIETPKQITQHMVLQFFLNGRIERNWTTETYLTYYMSLLVFFRWLVKNGYLQTNYIEHLDKPRREKSIPKCLTKRQAERILEIARNYPYTQDYMRYRNHALFATFLYAGLRKSELLNLKLADVNLENLTIFVHNGKGKKDRIVPIPYTLAYILEIYLKHRKKAGKTCPEFFTCSNRNKGLTDSGLKLEKNRIERTLKIKFSIHQLRHTFATLMHQSGCDIYSLSQMLGHSDIKTTTIYVSSSPEHLRKHMSNHPLNNNPIKIAA